MSSRRLHSGPPERQLADTAAGDSVREEPSAGCDQGGDAVEVLEGKLVEEVTFAEDIPRPRRTPRHTGVTVVVKVGGAGETPPSEAPRADEAVNAWAVAPRLDQRRPVVGRRAVPRFKAVASYVANARRRD